MRAALVFLFALALGAPARGAVVVIGNYTDRPVSFALAEPKAKARDHTLGANDVRPFFVAGPAVLTFAPKGKPVALELDAFAPYAFVPDRAEGVRLEALELPGAPLEADAKPDPNAVPRDPLKIAVTLYVDDTEARAEQLWQAALRERFAEASKAIERASGIRLELAAFGTWKSDPASKSADELLKGFETAVKVPPGALAVGYSSRKYDAKAEPAFAATRGLASRHVLLREWAPRNEPERAEALAGYLARALGAVGSPDFGSCTREPLADGYILGPGAVLRLDPLNALALNLWADERRREPGVAVGTLSPANRHRLARVYKALLKAAPGDVLAIAYLEDLMRDPAKKKENPPDAPIVLAARDALAARIVRAVRARAEENAKAAARTSASVSSSPVSGAAANVALAHDGPEGLPAFLLAVGVAFDDTGALLRDPRTAGAVRALESDADRKARLAVLGNPTLFGRRDVCRRFFVGCASGELLPPDDAERAAVARALTDATGATGTCVPVIAAEFAGVTFALATQRDANLLRKSRAAFAARDFVPDLEGLVNGLSAPKFAEKYGSASDERFAAVLDDVRGRVRKLEAYK
jgi:hypothetical protein